MSVEEVLVALEAAPQGDEATKVDALKGLTVRPGPPCAPPVRGVPGLGRLPLPGSARAAL